MKLTEQQLIELIRESAVKVINEIGYHEKQKREQSDEEHAEWIKKKSEAKKRELERQSKEKGDDKSDGKAIDYYDYKHGKGNFPIMKEEESTIRLSSSDFHKFLKESIKRVIKEMNGLPRNYDSWKTAVPDSWNEPDMIDKDDFFNMINSSDEKEQKNFVDFVKEQLSDEYENGVSSTAEFLKQVSAGKNPFMAAIDLGVKWEDIALEFFDIKPVKYYPGDNDPDPRDVKGLDEMDETTLDYDMDNFSGRWSRGPRYDILVDGEVYYSDVPDESVDRLCSDLERQGYENIQVKEL